MEQVKPLVVLRHYTRARPTAHPSMRMTAEDQDHMAIMVALNLWPKIRIAKVFGVSHPVASRIHEIRTVIDNA